MELSVLHFYLPDHKDNTTAKTGVVNKSSGTLTNSVLASGDWRFYIEKSECTKFQKKFLDDLGINTNTIDPRKLVCLAVADECYHYLIVIIQMT
jgi:predicted protein tyrosine phosphatase